MTLAPEVVLANELGIPTAAVVVGHKRSGGQREEAVDAQSLGNSLLRPRRPCWRWSRISWRATPGTPLATACSALPTRCEMFDGIHSKYFL